MSISRTFECQNCDTVGKIVIKSADIQLSDVTYCPVCGSDIYEEDDQDED
jgi:Zn finger protein HypA/HybF involved in hydrogenase expression